MASGVYLLLGNIVILVLFILGSGSLGPNWPLYWILTAVLYSFIVWGFFGVIFFHRRVKNAWAQIEVQLKKRNDLVPNLVETVKGYMKHERAVFTEITEARKAMTNAKTPTAMAKASDLLTGALKSIFAVAEAVPQLRASENFKTLQEQLQDVEEKLAFSRQFYNDSLMEYDARISSSHLIFAKILGYKRDEFKYFETPEAEKKAPKVKF